MTGRRTSFLRAAPFVMVAAAGTTLLTVAVPMARVDVRSLGATTVVLAILGMAEGGVALLAAERFRRSAGLFDYATAVALGLLAVGNLGFALSRATDTPAGVSAAPVLPLTVCAVAILAGAVPARDRPVARRPRRRLVWLVVVGLAVPLLLAGLLGPFRHVRVDPTGRLHEPATVLWLRAAIVALLVPAAIGLASLRERRHDPVFGWLIAALGLLAVAQLAIIVGHRADAYRFAASQVLLLTAAATLTMAIVEQVRASQREIAAMAVLDERRRMARDLHDGLNQEVAFIASHATLLANRTRDARLALIAEAAQRALDDSRSAIHALTRSPGPGLGASIAEQAREFAQRWGLAVNVDVQDDVELPPEKAGAVLRIVGEALFNAARHAGARSVSIEVDGGDGPLRVRIADDGLGFDVQSAQESGVGLGLRSMRERAEMVGGQLRLESEPGAGTRVEIAIP